MRLPDWEVRLHAVLDAVATDGHRYGEHDCGHFVARAIEAMTGVDFAAPFRKRYSTAIGAQRALRRHGAGSLEATITAALGDPLPLAWAHRGDVCWYQGVPGILQANHGVFVGSDEADRELHAVGLVRLPRAALDRERAWSVPF